MPFPPLPPPPAPLHLAVAAPCGEDWSAMGEGPTRRCARCATDVHDLGAAGPEVAADLVARGACVRFRVAADGSARFPRAAVLVGALALAACAPHPVAVDPGVAPTPVDPRCVAPAPAPLVEVPAGELHLLVIDDGGLPIPGARLTLRAAGQPARSAATDAEGIAILGGLGAGEWAWSVTRAGFSSHEGRLALGELQGAALTVELLAGDEPIVMGLVVVRSPAVDGESIPAGVTLPRGTLDRLPR